MWSKQSKDQGPDGKILHRNKLNILRLVTNLQVMPVLTDKTISIGSHMHYEYSNIHYKCTMPPL